MILGKSPVRRLYSAKCFSTFILTFFSILLIGGTARAQVATASISGTVKDSTGAVVPSATVTVKDIDTGATRTAQTGADGNYTVPTLQVGQYEVTAEKGGFKQEVRRGITLAVGQQAVVDMTLEVGNVAQQVTVTAEAPLVNTTLAQTSGLVNETEVKDLPLNGRSFDQLLTMNVGTNNYSSHTVHNGFSVVGRRPEENRFLMNGIEYFAILANGNTDTPYGSSGQLLGVDAVREFNVLQDTYGAEYGKRAGGQVNVVTSSGTNSLHGDVFEFLRNSDLDARNFYDHPVGERIPPFKRNQFGGAVGGPIMKNKLFIFGNYEGFRQRLGLSDVPFVPDANARLGILNGAPVPGLVTGMLPFLNYFWPAPNGPELGGGIAEAFANPVQRIREDFGLLHVDYDINSKDTLSGTYLIDDGENDNPQADPNFINLAPTRNQLIGLQETHVFSSAALNTITGGFSRSSGTSATIPLVPIPANLSFFQGDPPGTISIGGGGAGASASSITIAGGFQPILNLKNLFQGADDFHLIKGKHSISAGVWIERVQDQAEGVTANRAGSITFLNLQSFMQDVPEQFIGFPNTILLGFRTTLAAWYAQDEIKLKPNLTFRLGIRDEMTSGFNESQGRCSQYIYSNGVIQTTPLVGSSCLTQNNAIALWQPRIGLAWDPTGSGKWSVRAGFGIYNDLQDNLQGRLSSNPPFNAQLTLTTPLLSYIPLPTGTKSLLPSCSATQTTGCAIYSPGGVEPDMRTPTVQEWSLTVERQLTSNLMVRLGYVGSQSYHMEDSVDGNEAPPAICASAAGCVAGGTNAVAATPQTSVVPQGTLYQPPGTRPNPFVAQTFSWFYGGVSTYHAFNASIVKRTTHGLSFKADYTFSKILDEDSTPDPSAGNNQPFTILNVWDIKLSKGIAAFDLQNQFNANFTYELPFGNGKRFASSASGVLNDVIGGWQWNSIITAQSGFPFTPQAGSNRSGTGDTTNPDVANHNPAFTGPVILGTPNRWYNPAAFLLPAIGTYGNVSRGSFTGPGLVEFDTSLFKNIPFRERYNLEFRAEFFNIVNHTNLGSPNALVFAGATVNPSAGVITSTATTSRQIQFALKLSF